MELRRCFLAMGLVLCTLVACNKKQPDNSASQSPQDTSGTQSAQATPPSRAPAGATQSATPAPSTPEPVPAPPPEPVVIPSGTVLTVRLQQTLSSKTNNEGDSFNATLAEPVTVRGKTVVPAGSSVSGTVTEAHRAGRFKGGASLDIALNSLTIGDKTYQRLYSRICG
jgi:hypothetical protein